MDDLFDIEAMAWDLNELSILICPQIVSNFSTSPTGEDAVMVVDSRVTLTGDQLKPLYQLIGWLFLHGGR